MPYVIRGLTSYIRRLFPISMLAFALQISLASQLVGVRALAQTPGAGEEQADLDTIEAELSKSKITEKPEPTSARETQKAPEKISDLGKLSPFSEISVIQKRFLPKTERFQFNIGLATIANDPWFYGVGLGGRFGYAFRENLAVELNYSFLNNSPKEAVKDLKQQHAVDTDSIVTAKSYLGLDVVWSPIYGKLSLFNKRIVPFDMYFAGGAGQMGVSNARTSSATAFHFGTGQIFAMSKAVGLRWDLSFNFFQAQPTTAGANAGQFNTVLLTVGASFFFPEAKYR